MNTFRQNNRIKGAGTALVTPFKSDLSIDFDSFRRLIDYNIESGIDFLCVLGTTAETPTLNPEEQMAIRKAAVEQNAGRVPLLLGFGGNNTAVMIEKMKSDSFEGFDALLIVTPFYNKPNQEGLYQHYKALAAASPKPIVMYNVPGRTGVNLLPETVLRIVADCPNVVAVKEASGNPEQIKKLLAEKPEDFTVISGDDALTCELMPFGCAGVISVLSNALPEPVVAIVHDREVSEAVNEKMSVYYKPLFKEGNPVGIKAMMSLRGQLENYLRLPMVPASAALMDEFRKIV